MSHHALPLVLIAAWAALSGCGEPANGPGLKVDWGKPPTPPPHAGPTRHDPPASCSDGDLRAEAANRSGKALKARLRRGGANPETDAASAAARGRFEMVWVVPMGGRHPVGLFCDAPQHSYISTAMNLELAKIYVSDVPPRPGDPPDHDAERLGQYGRRYNLALLRDPAFPYPDLCRSGRPTRFVSVASVTRPEEWLASASPPTDRVRSLGEAARHGTPAALDRWIFRDRARLNRPDDFGLTPLAWAVLYDRPKVVRRLLAAGAQPAPKVCHLHPGASARALAETLKRPYADTLADD